MICGLHINKTFLKTVWRVGKWTPEGGAVGRLSHLWLARWTERGLVETKSTGQLLLQSKEVTGARANSETQRRYSVREWRPHGRGLDPWKAVQGLWSGVSGTRLLGFKDPLCHLSALWPRASGSTSHLKEDWSRYLPCRAAVRINGAWNSVWHAGNTNEHWPTLLLQGLWEKGYQLGNSENGHHLKIKKLEKADGISWEKCNDGLSSKSAGSDVVIHTQWKYLKGSWRYDTRAWEGNECWR